MAGVAKTKDPPTSLLSEKAHKLIESVNIYSETLKFLDGAFSSKPNQNVEKKADTNTNNEANENSRKSSTCESAEIKKEEEQIPKGEDVAKVSEENNNGVKPLPRPVEVTYSISSPPIQAPESLTASITSDLQNLSKEMDEKLTKVNLQKPRNSFKIDDSRSSSNSISVRKSIIKESSAKTTEISDKNQAKQTERESVANKKQNQIEPEIIRKESIAAKSTNRKESAAIAPSFTSQEVRVEMPTLSKEPITRLSDPALEASGLLLSKVSTIESELQSLKESAKKDTNDTIKSQNHDLLLKNSRQSIEMKSFMDQNNTLRKENKRLLELEASLRARIVELEMPNQKLAVIDPQDQVIQERLLQKLDEHLAWISSRTVELQTISEDLLHTTKLQEKLQMYTESCTVLKKSIRNAVNAPNVKHFLIISSGIVDAIIMDSKEIWQNYKEAKDIDQRLIKLGKESHRIRIEATETIQNLTGTNEKQVTELNHKLKKAELKLKAVSEKHKLLNDEYEKLGKEHQDLIQQNKELKVLADRPPVQPEVVVLSSSEQSEQTKREFEKLLETNNQYKQLIENLKTTIQEWKSENDLLQTSLKEFKQKYEQSEGEVLKFTKKIGNMETLLEDEKLKNQKAAELLKSLQSQPVQVKHESTPIDAILQSHLQALDSIIQKPVPPPTKNFESLQQKINQHLRDLAEKDSLISQLNQKLDDKFHIREEKWSEKLRALKQGYFDIQSEITETATILGVYQEQYNVVSGLVVSNTTSTHPYPFSQLFVGLHERYISLQAELNEMKDQLNKLVQKSEHDQLVLQKEKQSRKELGEKLGLKEKIVCEFETKMQEIKLENARLVNDLHVANLEKLKAKEIVKKLTKGAVEFFSH
ncbi:hypothetical protein HDV06_006539 [Boothiomyces sp. JEL0866]|nr:hypothetical protein HDV06_006539 [Boothiomyces sp. JEL0866]